jgi:hypothetical protein
MNFSIRNPQSAIRNWEASHLDILSELSEVIVWSERKRLLDVLSV